MQAAAPIAPVVSEVNENTIAAPTSTELIEDHAYPAPPTPEPIPIATSGELNLMPPSTGLPVSNSTLTPVLDSIPHIPDPEPATADIAGNEASHHG
jgi:sec-independent protein translocase protein TatB